MPIYEYYCSACNKRVDVFHSIKDIGTLQRCGCGEGMVKLISLPQPAIFVITNTNMLVNALNNDDKAYKFPGNGKHDKRYKAAIKRSLTRDKTVIGKGFQEV